MQTRYYVSLLKYYLSGIFNGDFSDYSESELLKFCNDKSIKYHIFKSDKVPLKRVSWVINKLKGIYPETLLDIGTGRGAFLMPLLSTPILNHIKITCIDKNLKSIEIINFMNKGGLKRIQGIVMRAEDMGFKSRSFDVVTSLEVIEHIPNTEKVFSELFRITKEYVILSVPSKEDNNPEHIHFFTSKKLNDYIFKYQPDINKIETVFVRGHLIKVVRI